MTDHEQTWSENAKLVLQGIARLEENQAQMSKEINSIHIRLSQVVVYQEKVEKDTEKMKNDIVSLQEFRTTAKTLFAGAQAVWALLLIVWEKIWR